ncbi:hypothetical protein G6F56_009761 [Rhizopus delemar]|nr:hypothetical protein G6F56_009761 [Rhizopus delemar]
MIRNQGRLEQETRPQEDVPVTTIPFWVSLEELYSGSLKHIAIKVNRRDRVTDDYSTLSKLITINVDPRWRASERVIRENAGDELENGKYNTLVFVMREKRHHLFTRIGDNLHMKVHLSLLEALVGFNRQVDLLDGRILELEKTGTLTSYNDEQRIPNVGLINSVTGIRGSLIIHYEVMFPLHFSAKQRQQLRKTLA